MGEGEPSDQKTDGVVGGFGYGVEKGDIFCPDGLDVVNESCDKKGQQRIEKGWAEVEVCLIKACGRYRNSQKEKRDFPDLPLDQGTISLRGVVGIIWSVHDFVDDIICSGDGPCQEKCVKGLKKDPSDIRGKQSVSVQVEKSCATDKHGEAPRPSAESHRSEICLHVEFSFLA